MMERQGQVKFFNMWTLRFSGTNVGVFIKSVDCRYATSGFPLMLWSLCDNIMLCGLLLPCSVCDIRCGCLPPSSSAHLLRVTMVLGTLWELVVPICEEALFDPHLFPSLHCDKQH